MSKDWILPLYKIYTDDEDVNLVSKTIKRGMSWALGPEIEEFENLISEYVGVNYCVCLNSGTSALHSTLLAYDIKPNDQIITSSFSFISTANSITFVNAKPIFADIEEETFGLDPIKVENKISPSVKALMPMDYAGQSCKINELKQIAEQNNLILIEDAAEGLGSSVNGKKVGSLADSAIFSFCGNKVLTTGEGGAVVTNSKEIFEKIKLFRSHGRVDSKNYFNSTESPQYTQVGFNWRMSSITAALGISQLKKLDKIIKKRQKNAEYLSSRLSSIDDIIVPSTSNGFEHIYQMYTIRLKNSLQRKQLQEFLNEKKIFSKVYFDPIHLTSFYKQNYQTHENILPITEKIANQVLTLPLYPNMELEEKNYLIDSIHEFFENIIK